MKTAEEILEKKFPNAKMLDWYKPLVECMQEYLNQSVSEKDKLKELEEFINGMVIQQPLLNGETIPTIHIPSLLHKISELKSLPNQSVPTPPVTDKPFPTASVWLREYEIMCTVMDSESAMRRLVDAIITKYESIYC